MPFWLIEMGKIFIKHDVFNIIKRLKKIDKNYFIVYNLNSKKFEVHHKASTNTLQLVLPYTNLDKRTLDLVLKTSVENQKKLLDEMEQNNKKLETEKQNRLLDEVSFKAKDMLKYAESKTGENVNFNDSYKTKWI